MKLTLPSLTSRNARNQALTAIVLIAVIPALSLFFLGTVISHEAEQLPFAATFLLLILTFVLAVMGFLILRKYPDNILKLRQYITEVAAGTLPDRISLVDTHSSDDIRYIEQSFNTVLNEMRRRIEDAELLLKKERILRETIEQQQENLLEADRQRVMIQSLGAACHHIGQPATVLRMRLHLLEEAVQTEDAREEIRNCMDEVGAIADILQQLQQVSEYRTEPYLSEGHAVDDHILSINFDPDSRKLAG